MAAQLVASRVVLGSRELEFLNICDNINCYTNNSMVIVVSDIFCVGLSDGSGDHYTVIFKCLLVILRDLLKYYASLNL
jgi:uncharacterized membrane protein